ncbi:ABC transporter ATP-binding protein [Peribacillus huizhouensis]|uniref:Spermidine/putrescine transport system ATP-binding protein n=1 Tax=Peribacillus huizhouensis TaxID=1501239 RepID=A0ABR6CUX2_9BACI|nr:ABC transporter ATP-binding protein [Peribacillus huizhouensis]MBA9028721.1 putative spermidine/putrescine transport system ATP-binding protein [Peribacillus huizhouensis]
MSKVVLKDVHKQYKDAHVLSGIDMNIEDGEFVTLLGPSGCGKSTILRILSGLTEATGGNVMIDGKDMKKVPPKNRQVGMVFQSYALFPNMTVYENVAFGLKMRKQPVNEIAEHVEKMINLVGLKEKKEAFPHELSGGQQQRVALARSLVVRPKVLLLDEPLSALDAQIRKHLQVELRTIQRELKMTMILVTHDQEEAMTVSDRIFVMNQGKIAQEGTPFEIYTQPKTEFVANFIGRYNVFTKEQIENLLGGKMTILAAKYAIRPESIQFQPQTSSYPIRAIAGDSIMNGNVIRTTFHADNKQFTMEQLHHQSSAFEKGTEYQLFVEPKDVIALS